MSVQNPDRVVSKQDLADFYETIFPYLGGGGGGGSSTVIKQTLAAGSTTITFSNLPTSGDYIIRFSTSNGMNYSAIDTSTAGQATLTFSAQASAIAVYCEIKGV